MSSTGKDKEKEIVHDEVEQVTEDHEEDSEDEGSDEEPTGGDQTAPSAITPSTTGKKKKKLRKQALNVVDAFKTNDKVVNKIVENLQQQGMAGPEVNAENVRAALQSVNLKDILSGKTDALGGTKNKKETGGHKFWSTQPVPQLGEELSEQDGYIEAPKESSELRQEPYPLPKEFEWSHIEVNNEAQLRELYELLSANYVEDDDASFRFLYSAEFLKWALQPPGYFKEWHIAVRVASNKKLVAFISAVPVTLRVRDNIVKASEVNFLCVHKKLRSKRLAPVLIKEVTRQCNVKGVFQALYTAGVLIPTPVATARYYHRCLNINKLVTVRFTHVPSNMTLARMIRLNKVADRPKLEKSGLREMEDKDVPEVADLYTAYTNRFGLAIQMSHDEIRHQLLSGRGEGPGGKDSWKNPRAGQVVWTYVVENPQTHKITDFVSFYSLPSTIMQNPKYNVLNAAYLFYYATDIGLDSSSLEDGRLKKRLEELIGDALIIADQSEFDVFNALTVMDNVEFLEDLRFGAGDGLLNYYLYNWRTKPVAGMTAVGDVPAGRGIGVAML